MLVIGLALGSATALAGPDKFGSGRGLPPEFAAFDKDGNGVLSEEEKAALKAAIEEQRKAFLAKIDTSGDGKLSEAELAAWMTGASAERVKATLTRMDTDKDGFVSLAEFTAKPQGPRRPPGGHQPPGGQGQPPRPPRGGRP
jgi:Ca2+-binding EF-hand superfamily protein